MSRVKIDMPDSFSFNTRFPVRITDLNYGAHVGNDTVLSFIHEARVRFLQSLGYSELNLGGTGLIMSDVAIEFKKEIHYGDEISISVAARDFSRVGFDLVYKMEKNPGPAASLLALAKTGMVCYDYSMKKVSPLPEEARQKLAL
ncbi:MAG: thioesterase family protein [Bacteroidota bacterium]|nr:thioesterase family protein [Bacteroidota bacterium]MDP4212757.1 thioesterase family protein [Bacteroidota bacterium]MDP4249338.1 thioesterase family protein [Bacteroidota bacterium]